MLLILITAVSYDNVVKFAY